MAAVPLEPPRPAPPLLYRDVLQSVLSFLPFRGLVTALAVCRSWAAAVDHMPPALLPCEVDPFGHPVTAEGLAHLGRHIGQLGFSHHSRVDLPASCVAQLGRLCPHLDALACDIDYPREESAEPTGVALALPRGLRWLYFNVARRSKPSAICLQFEADLFQTILSLQQLRSLHISDVGARTSLGGLQQLPLLRELRLRRVHDVTDRLVSDLRALEQLHTLELARRYEDSPGWFNRLLAAPAQQLQWRELAFGNLSLSDDRAQLLCALPELEQLDVSTADCWTFHWLTALPALRHLRINLRGLRRSAQLHLLGAFASDRLSALRLLTLRAGWLSCDDLSQLLAHLPRLELLELDELSGVDSLHFLEQPSLQRSLTHLTIHGSNNCSFTADHLPSLVGLTQLQELHLLQWPRNAPERLTDEQRAPFEQRPCAVLAHLRIFRWRPSVI